MVEEGGAGCGRVAYFVGRCRMADKYQLELDKSGVVDDKSRIEHDKTAIVDDKTRIELDKKK